MSFTRFSAFVSRWTSRPEVFVLAVAAVLFWAVSGPIFGFSEAWQLVINTVTTVITFLMVFIIQASQNRDLAAMHVKLDELIRATKEAKNAVLDVDDMTEDELRALRKRYARLAHIADLDAESLDQTTRNESTTARSPEPAR